MHFSLKCVGLLCVTQLGTAGLWEGSESYGCSAGTETGKDLGWQHFRQNPLSTQARPGGEWGLVGGGHRGGEE